MKSFLEASVCNGGRPKFVKDESYFIRNALLLALMSDRRRVRYLLAPTEFGKTTLACTYAEINFEFRDTSWISGSSPCFLRDLDAGGMAEGIMRFISPEGLVVIDDVPALDADRSTKLWDCCRDLIRSGREVLVLSTPGADPLHDHLSSCIVLRPDSFLLSDDEILFLHGKDPISPSTPVGPSKIDRIPGLLQANEEGQKRFLSHIVSDNTQTENALLFIMLTLGQGTVKEVIELANMSLDPSMERCQRTYPYISIDPNTGEFSAHGFTFATVARTFRKQLPALASICYAESSSTLALRLADALLSKRDHDRAVEVIAQLCPSETRARWLAVHQWDMMDHGCIFSLERLYTGLKGTREYHHRSLMAGSAIRGLLITRTAAAQHTVTRIVRTSSYDTTDRLIAATSLTILGDDITIPSDRTIQRSQDTPEILLSFWKDITEYGDTDRALEGLVSSAYDHDASSECLSFVLASALHMTDGIPSHLVGSTGSTIQRILDRANEYTLAHYFLIQGARRCSIPDIMIDENNFEAVSSLLDEERSKSQRSQHSDPFGTPSMVGHVPRIGPVDVPPLEIHMFGQFRVILGDTELDPKRFTSHKAKCLLATLATTDGHAVSCMRLAAEMWPESPDFAASHNFSNTYSKLKCSLTLPDGRCPYVSRSQGVVRLHPDIVHTDIGDLLTLCHRLMKETFSKQELEAILERSQDIFIEDLLPDLNDESTIGSIRKRCSRDAADAMAYTAKNLVRSGDPYLALEYVRQALKWNPKCEICYELAMTIQGRIGQRPAAIDTWQDYVRHMQELGMDPSAHMSELYLRIIEGKDLDDL